MTNTASEPAALEIRSDDGTNLAARRSGQGRPVVLVHGSATDKGSFAVLEPALRATRTVWTYDRRGRGESADASDYSVDLEAQDFLGVLAAASASTDEQPDVVAHSFGASCVLRVADAARMRSLAVYEPALFGSRLDETDRTELRTRLAGQDWDGALDKFLRLYGGSTDREVQILRSLPDVWTRLIDATRVLSREIDATDSYDLASIRSSEVPMLALYGEESTCANFPNPGELRELFPAAQIRPVPGQRHLAFVFAADAVLSRLADFWTGL
jgi:pimeloyl-ACP methyl ester carboxylesterase